MHHHALDAGVVSWGALLFLGAFHGINPGMGWLFAVALGMQENRQAAVWRAMLPLGVGHAAAIGVAILGGMLAGAAIPSDVLRWPVAALLMAVGVRKLVRPRHPRWGGMRIGMGGLAIWSFLIGTAHGAGLMVLPFWLAIAHPDGQIRTLSVASGLTATAVHAAGYLAVTAAVAWIVFAKLGVGLLKQAWINLDVIWAAALIITGGLTLALPGI